MNTSEATTKRRPGRPSKKEGLIKNAERARNARKAKYALAASTNETPELPESDQKSIAVSSAQEPRKRANVAAAAARSASTPRRRRNMLDILSSTLSPKYIGGEASPAALGTKRQRKLRNQNTNKKAANKGGKRIAAAVASPTNDGGTSADSQDQKKYENGNDDGGKNQRKTYQSPIEKLLIKNGGASPEELSVNPLFQSPAKGGAEAEVIHTEKAEVEVVHMEKDEVELIHMEKGETEVIHTEADETEVIHTEKDDSEQPQPPIEATESEGVDDDGAEKPQNPIECNNNENAEKGLKLQRLLSEEAQHASDLLLELNGGEVVKSFESSMLVASMNSPSALSLDSAKGSSVVTDSTWITYTTGDLFWGQIYSYCYWPCMVCPDPDGRIVMTEHGRQMEQCMLVHARFFADNARRNWVKTENLLTYNGFEEYLVRIGDIKKNYGKKSAIYKLFVPKPSRKAVWQRAIEEANVIAEAAYPQRLERFYEIYENNRVLQKLERKRRQSMVADVAKMYQDDQVKGDMSAIVKSKDLSEEVTPKGELTVSVKQEATSKETSLDEDPTEEDAADSSQSMKPELEPEEEAQRTSVDTEPDTQKRARIRSTSPPSPAYSPLQRKAHKRRKMNSGESATVSHTPDNYAHSRAAAEGSTKASISKQTALSLQDVELFRGSDFKRFLLMMRDFVMEDNRDEELEKSLLVAVRNIWALKQINQTQVQQRLLETYDANELGSVLVESDRGDRGVKRLSTRLKTLLVRNRLINIQQQKQQTSAEAKSVTTEVAKEEKSMEERPKKVLNRPIEEVIEDIFNLDKKYLFKGMGREPVCKYCLKGGGQLLRCEKSCHSWLHVDCQSSGMGEKRAKQKSIDGAPVDEQSAEPPKAVSSVVAHVTADDTSLGIVCQECSLDESPKCNVCQSAQSAVEGEPLLVCNLHNCAKALHASCCRYWPQTKINKSQDTIKSFRCPSHSCHTCVSDDPRRKFQNLPNTKLTKCLKCPATYHTDSNCIPAGSQILSAAHIICPRHNDTTKGESNLNVSWCFICVKGGQVICCDTCPTSVHTQCLNLPFDPADAYICDECESGRLPLYGEVVWAKFNSFRWWPAIILPPTEVPQNITRKPHNPLDFVVRFFGTHDHGWISRRRVYLYLEGDESAPPKSKNSLDSSYNRGVAEAKRIFQIIQGKKKLRDAAKDELRPQPYIRLKTIRAVPPVRLQVDIEKVNKCECDPFGESPCGPDSNCLNRVLFHECHPKICPAGNSCQNQMFETRVSPRLEVAYMKERGFGLICREAISAGTFIIEYVGEIINAEEFRQRMAQKSSDRDENFYFLTVEKDYIIDAGPKGNAARFMNHSCDPNCETQKWTVSGLHRIGLFAIKDIPKDTELTFNYHWDDVLGNEKKNCYCGAANCAGQIGAKTKEERAKESAEPQVKQKLKNGGKARSRKTKSLKRLQVRKPRVPKRAKEQEVKDEATPVEDTVHIEQEKEAVVPVKVEAPLGANDTHALENA